MPKLSDFFEETEDEKNAVLKHYNVTEDEFNESVRQLKAWLAKSGLPDDDWADTRLPGYLLMSKMSMEKTKTFLKDYYRLRTIQPHFYNLHLPYTDGYNTCKSFVYSAIMPKLTPDLCKIHIIRNADTNAEITDGSIYGILAFMEAECRFMYRHFYLSTIVIIDLKNFGLKTLLKYTPTVCQQLVTVLLGMHLRFKNIHFVNAPTFIDKVIFLLRTILPTKLFKKVCTHTSFDTLYEYIPREYLPSDYQGTQPSIATLHEEWCEVLENMEKDFRKLLSVKCESLETSSSHDNFIEMGCEGSFKKLSID